MNIKAIGTFYNKYHNVMCIFSIDIIKHHHYIDTIIGNRREEEEGIKFHSLDSIIVAARLMCLYLCGERRMDEENNRKNKIIN